MKTWKDFVLGYAPTRRNVFSKEDALKHQKDFEEGKGKKNNHSDRVGTSENAGKKKKQEEKVLGKRGGSAGIYC